MPITDPEEVKKIMNRISEQEHMERDTKFENSQKASHTRTRSLPKNSERKPNREYPAKSSYQNTHEKGKRRTEYEPGTALSRCGFAKDGVSKRKKFGLKYPPESKRKQNDMAEELVAWSEQTDSLQIEDFPILCGISPMRFFQVAHKNAYFQECLDIARHNIGSRLFHGVAHREIDKSLPSHVYPLYNQQYNDYLHSRDERKAQHATAHAQIQTVEIPSAPSTDMVPERTDDPHSSSDTESGEL